jgi:PAS domain S-box-containing protein
MAKDSARLPADVDVVVRNLPDLYLVLTPDLTICGASVAYLAATNTTDDIIGRQLFEVFPDSPQNEHQGMSALRSSLDRVIRLRSADTMALQRYDLVRPDGSAEVRYWSPINAPVPDGAGELRWILHRVSDVTAIAGRHAEDVRLAELECEVLTAAQRLGEANANLRRSEARLSLALEVGRMAVWHWRVSEGRLVVTPELNVLLGLPPELETSFEQIETLMPPSDSQSLWETARTARANGDRYFEHDFMLRRPNDGELRAFQLRAELVKDCEGTITDALGIVADVTAQRDAEERKRVLMHELNHRVKNNLAVVQAIAARTFRDQGCDDALDRFVQRLSAFGRAHDILTQEQWSGAFLKDLIVGAFETVGLEAGRFRLSGPALRLSPDVALNFGLALHELAVNAVKHGALSTPEGVIEVHWRTGDAGDGQKLIMDWQERGGPAVAPPARRGSGTQLLERIFPPQLGHVELRYRPTGLESCIEVKLTGASPGR